MLPNDDSVDKTKQSKVGKQVCYGQKGLPGLLKKQGWPATPTNTLLIRGPLTQTR